MIDQPEKQNTDIILIADDELEICKSLSEALTNQGYWTDYVQNGKEALEYLEENKVDVLILDIKMPVMDGWQVLRELNKKRMKTKVLVVTANSDVRSAIDSVNLGAIDFIGKPYDFEDMLASLKNILMK